MEIEALFALLATTAVPLALPLDLGANVSVSVADCSGERTVPLAIPLGENALPIVETVEIVRLAFPVFVTVTL